MATRPTVYGYSSARDFLRAARAVRGFEKAELRPKKGRKPPRTGGGAKGVNGAIGRTVTISGCVHEGIACGVTRVDSPDENDVGGEFFTFANNGHTDFFQMPVGKLVFLIGDVAWNESQMPNCPGQWEPENYPTAFLGNAADFLLELPGAAATTALYLAGSTADKMQWGGHDCTPDA